MLQSELKILEEQFGDFAKEMQKTYCREAEELLRKIDQILSDFSGDQTLSEEDLNAIMRDLHTLKGINAQSGFQTIGKMIHSIEDLFLKFKNEGGFISEVTASLIMGFNEILYQFIEMLLEDEPSNNQFDDLEDSLKGRLQEILTAPQQKSDQSPQQTKKKQKVSRNIANESTYQIPRVRFHHIIENLERVLQLLNQATLNLDLKAAISLQQEALFNLTLARTSTGQILKSKINKMVSDISRELGKDISITINGFEERIDTGILQSLSDCLVHMVKNSIDHGIESPEERIKNQKPKQASLTLTHVPKSDRSIFILKDDGRGLDPQLIAERALKKQLIDQEKLSKLTTYERQELIFLPGFSTKNEVSEISGRGVGMDVVKNEVKKHGGRITFESEPLRGTSFFIEFPRPYMFEPSVVFSYHQTRFAVASSAVIGLIIDPYLVENEFGTVSIETTGQSYTQIELREIDVNRKTTLRRPYIILNLGGNECALAVDRIEGFRKIFFYATEKYQAALHYIQGASNDPSFGAVFGLDLSEIERNFNLYLPKEEEAFMDTDLLSLTAQPTAGGIQMTSQDFRTDKSSIKGQVLTILESDEFTLGIQKIVEPILNQTELLNPVIEFIAREVDRIKETIHPIDDQDEVEYALAILYTQIKANWILYNTKFNYLISVEKEPSEAELYQASFLTFYLGKIEQVINPDAVKKITITLGQTIRELSAPLSFKASA